MRQEALRKELQLPPRLGRGFGAKLHRKKQNKRGESFLCIDYAWGSFSLRGLIARSKTKKFVYAMALVVAAAERNNDICMD